MEVELTSEKIELKERALVLGKEGSRGSTCVIVESKSRGTEIRKELLGKENKKNICSPMCEVLKER